MVVEKAPSPAALRAYHSTVGRMLTDRDCTGDLLLVGMWLARAVHLDLPKWGTWDTTTIALDLYGKGRPVDITGIVDYHVDSHHISHIHRVLRNDRPRYDPMVDNPGFGTCTAPTPRKARCGRRSTMFGFLYDTDTGRAFPHGACNKHRQWYGETNRAHRAKVAELGDRMPKPAANTGGALARHIHRINWPSWWKQLDTGWEPPAEGAPTRRPTLTVLRCDEPEPPGPASDDVPASPPSLTVIRGGW